MGLLPPLPTRLADEVMQFLGVPSPRHDQAWLDTFVQRYGQRVPWESASRVARLATSPRTDCPRPPETFWRGTLTDGTGGTCFETNAAVAALLAALDFAGDLTINDIADHRACHTALVVRADDERVLVDVGYPIYAVLPLRTGPTTRASPWFTYRACPSGDGRYRIENRPHPAPYVYDLIDVAVEGPAYLEALVRDYQPGGLFLDRVVIRKVVDDRVWRFTSHERPWRLQCFVDGQRIDSPLPDAPHAAADRLAQHFGMPASTIAAALRAAG